MCQDAGKENTNEVGGGLTKSASLLIARRFVVVSIDGEVLEEGSIVKAKVDFSDTETEISPQGFSIDLREGKVVSRHDFNAKSFLIFPWIKIAGECLSQKKLSDNSENGVLFKTFQECLKSLKSMLYNIPQTYGRVGILVKNDVLVSLWILSEGKLTQVLKEIGDEE